MASIKDRLKAARRPEKVVPVCLRGDLAAEFEQVRRDLGELAEPTADDSLAAGGKRRELVERLQAIRDEMREATVDFRLRALGRARFWELALKFPPRDGVERDKQMGANEEELIAALLRECLVDPELDEQDWATLEDTLTYAQYNEIGSAVWFLNQEQVSVPFLPPALLNHRNSGSG
jgi:hypothetical protein